MQHNYLKQLWLLGLLVVWATMPAQSQAISPCPATGISTDPAQPANPLRPDRRNTFFNWFAPGGTGPSANLFYQLYGVDPGTGQGQLYQEYSPYQQPKYGNHH